jgi:hypothetical protein
MDVNTLITLTDTARDLTEPGEPNGEYIRGQANLIADVSGVQFFTDNYGDALTHYIALGTRGSEHEDSRSFWMNIMWAERENLSNGRQV